MQIEMLSAAMLRPYKQNARTHSKKQIRQIADSIKRFGFCNPVLIDDDNQIIAGHGRVSAAKLLGYDKVPTVRLSHLTEVEKRAYVIADNRLAEKAGWDREVLSIELQGLVDQGFEITLTGYEPGEMDVMIEETSEHEERIENDIPEYRKDLAVARTGDLWCLGNHRLLCGDARDETSYQLLMGTEKAEFAFTDPPYNVPIDGHVCGLGRIRHDNFAMGCGEMSSEQFTALLSDVFGLMCRYSKDGAIHQVCMDWRHLDEISAAGRANYSELKNVCMWNKSNAGMGSFYRNKHEFVFVWKHGTAPHINNFELGQYGRSRSNVWDYADVNTFRAGRLDELAMHPTVKPVALVADAIKDCSLRGGIVLDPFCGSGTVLIAAQRTGRQGACDRDRSALGGTVIDRQVALGEHVSEQKPTFTIADLSNVWIDFSVYRRDLNRVRVGDTVMIDAEDGGPQIESKISYVSPVGSADTQSALARTVVSNTDLRLRPGLFVTGRLLLSAKPVGIAVKTSALQTHENRTVIFVRVGDKFEVRDVEIGDRDPEQVEVLFGLVEGDVYAAKNSFVIKAELAKGSASHDH